MSETDSSDNFFDTKPPLRRGFLYLNDLFEQDLSAINIKGRYFRFTIDFF